MPTICAPEITTEIRSTDNLIEQNLKTRKFPDLRYPACGNCKGSDCTNSDQLEYDDEVDDDDDKDR